MVSEGLFLSSVVREIKQRLGRGERVSCGDIWRNVPGRQNSKFQAPETGVCLEDLRNNKEASEA